MKRQELESLKIVVRLLFRASVQVNPAAGVLDQSWEHPESAAEAVLIRKRNIEKSPAAQRVLRGGSFHIKAALGGCHVDAGLQFMHAI